MSNSIANRNMCHVIAVANNKGGISKTTTCINLAKGLSDAGKRVLVIDSDPQGNATAAVGYDEPDSIEENLGTVMKMIINDDEIGEGYGVLTTTMGFDILPGNIDLSEMEVTLVNTMDRERVMKQYVTMVSPFYDYNIVDCAPSLGTITTNALVAANSVLIPVQSSFLPVKGLEALIKHIMRIKKHINYDLEIEGILMTLVDGRSTFAKQIIEIVKQSYGNQVRVFKQYIPRSVRAEESTAEGKSIFEYDPKGKVAAAYRALTEEILGEE